MVYPGKYFMWTWEECLCICIYVMCSLLCLLLRSFIVNILFVLTINKSGVLRSLTYQIVSLHFCYLLIHVLWCYANRSIYVYNYILLMDCPIILKCLSSTLATFCFMFILCNISTALIAFLWLLLAWYIICIRFSFFFFKFTLYLKI